PLDEARRWPWGQTVDPLDPFGARRHRWISPCQIGRNQNRSGRTQFQDAGRSLNPVSNENEGRPMVRMPILRVKGIIHQSPLCELQSSPLGHASLQPLLIEDLEQAM